MAGRYKINPRQKRVANKVVFATLACGRDGGVGNAGEIKINLKGEDVFTSCRHPLKKELAVSHLPSSLLKMQAERQGCSPLYLIYRVFAKKKRQKICHEIKKKYLCTPIIIKWAP